MSDSIREVAEKHVFMEASGGYTECSCGWPTEDQWEAGEPPALHVIKEALQELQTAILEGPGCDEWGCNGTERAVDIVKEAAEQ